MAIEDAPFETAPRSDVGDMEPILERLREAVGELFSARIVTLPRAAATPILCGLRARTLSMKVITTLQAGEPIGVSCYAIGDSGLEELLFEVEGGPPQRFFWAPLPDPGGLV